MSDRSPAHEIRPDPVQEAYATILRWVVVLGLAIIAVSFSLYVTGVVPSPVDIREVPDLWHLGTHEFRGATGEGTGWEWAASPITGRSLAFASIAFFPASMAAVATAAAGLYWKHRPRAYAFFALAEALVLAFAASGLLTT